MLDSEPMEIHAAEKNAKDPTPAAILNKKRLSLFALVFVLGPASFGVVLPSGCLLFLSFWVSE